MAGQDETRTALVVGAGSGIGRATALKLAASGARVVAADLNADSVAVLALEHDNIVDLGESWNAVRPEECDRLVASAVERVGHIDTVISTVGWTAITKFLDETPDYWQRIIDVNLMSAIYLSASAARVMQERGGSIVLTSSEAGTVGTSGEAVYSAAKAAVIGLVKSLAREWARYGIRVNAVAPGITSTPLLVEQGITGGDDSQGDGDAVLRSILRGVPLRRLGEPSEIADAITFLAGDGASYITGQTLCVGGGLTMGS
ncbi:NAD(P)-dependent oxidoreductase [Rhodococcus sp. 06-156-3C]|uniref:SDR family NAD(P)-dependent oxidoreductase n=1 Tax=Nocardiaceae TaxID=85025 RepID=UPI00052304FE|nr:MULTISPECIES: SDR family NAD(P)-dependent oxidoreductase [Rhodococcus]OZD11644.1 NAD(P)-dependent oxidoreductase [Rhodococcus sp. 06-156-4C]OZD15486.1 NAD(P)-dependent oxidoreductase [Rhodococcus sp. 06-156-4a]OZD23652.1 NAD(P)-dependent oxidoreductase [Rhodococcus sp. 06-156-3C]OZD27276.1 NAD(P)-dependent oxidoreductase [Rhodococcus sp. 06-156-3b]OZD31328.1 NAD(P)-dependent oxidoreductase [Rhodococcus sp. 06-156-3]